MATYRYKRYHGPTAKDFYAEWCESCREPIPHAKRHSDGLCDACRAKVAIAVDAEKKGQIIITLDGVPDRQPTRDTREAELSLF